MRCSFKCSLLGDSPAAQAYRERCKFEPGIFLGQNKEEKFILASRFSLQIMHLPDASNVKNCNPFPLGRLVLAERQMPPEVWICPCCLPDAEVNTWVPLLWPRGGRAKPPLGLRH